MNKLTIRKKIAGPAYRKFVRPVIRVYPIKKISSSQLKNLKTKDESDDIRLIGFLQIHNESKKGNLERVLNHLSRFCDDVVIYDDGSTDDSYEIASKFTKNIIRSSINDFKGEIAHKQKLLDLGLSLNPDWIVWLDADEVFDRDGELYAVRDLCRYGESEKIDGFSFLEFNLWRSLSKYRVDEQWHKLWQIRLWRNTGDLEFIDERGLHKQIVPSGMKKICRTDVKVIHYGFSSKERIDEKYEMYRRHGQTGIPLERISDEKDINLKPFSRDWYPLSTFKVVVVCLIYKSTKYLEFVLNSFNRHTTDAELLFIANDATDKVKNYLTRNKINHLVFDNKDKDEHYIKRVYRAWNFGGSHADGDIIVFVNSDMAFSENWLENLLKNLKKDRIVTSRLVESGKLESGKTAISKNFGKSYKEFDQSRFEDFAKEIREDRILKGGLFMPCAIYKDIFVKSGGYPIGNTVKKSGKVISGDWIYFYKTLNAMNIKHYTVADSIVYHIQEGEMDE